MANSTLIPELLLNAYCVSDTLQKDDKVLAFKEPTF